MKFNWHFFNEILNAEKLRKYSGKTTTSIPCFVARLCRLEGDWGEISPELPKKITEVKLDYTDQAGKVRGLASLICDHDVERLSLVNTCLQTEDLRTFFEELKKVSAKKKSILISLNLKFLELEPEGCEFLAKIVNLLPSIEVLVLTNCELGDEGILKFLNSIHEGKVIKKLFLDENDGFTVEGILNIGRLAKKCKVEEMALGHCYLTDDHLKELSKERPEAIRSVSLRDLPDLSKESISDFVQKWCPLEEIDLRGHDLSLEHFTTLRSELERLRVRVIDDDDNSRTEHQVEQSSTPSELQRSKSAPIFRTTEDKHPQRKLVSQGSERCGKKKPVKFRQKKTSVCTTVR